MRSNHSHSLYCPCYQRVFRSIFLSLIAAFIWSAAQGAKPDTSDYMVNFTHYTENDGLLSNEVLAVQKDSRGIIWVGTKAGLNRFDGKTFEGFTVQKGLTYDAIYEFYKPDERHLWLFHREEVTRFFLVKSIDVLDTYTEKVVPIEAFYGSKMPFKTKDLVFCFQQDGKVFFQVKSGQHYAFSSQKGFYKIPLPHDEVFAMELPNGHFLTFSKKYQLAGKNLLRLRTPQGKFISSRIEDFWHIQTVRGDKQGNITTINYNQNVPPVFKVLDKNLNLKMSKPLSITSKEAEYLVEGFLYWKEMNAYYSAGGQSNKLFLIDSVGNKLLDYSHPKNELLITLKRQILLDGNTVWQCSFSGLYRFEINKKQFKHLFKDFDKTIGFRGITQQGNQLFYGCENGLFSTDLALNESNKLVVPHSALSVIKSADGGIWAGNFKRIYKYHPSSKKVQHYSTPQTNEPWSFYEDKDGRLWFGNDGLYILNPKDGTVDTVQYNGFDDLSRSAVYYFYPNGKNRLLLCSTSGLYELDIYKGIQARYWTGGKGKYLLPNDDFRHLYYDEKQQTFWLATGQRGLLKWHPKSGEAQSFFFHEGTANVIHGVYADDFGHLWLPTEKGLVQFDKQTYRFRIYTTKDGISNNEFNRISHFQDAQGRLFFGTINGVTVFHPSDFKDELEQNTNVVPMVVSLEQYVGKADKLLNNTYHFIQNSKISLRPEDRFFTLTLGMSNYKWSDEAIYFFQLKNIDTSWTRIESNQLTLGRLPYGNQVLRIKALLDNGQYTDKVLELPIWVQRPFYLSWWFILLFLSTIAAIAYAAYRYQIDQFKKRQALRTQIATDLHDDVGSILARLAIQAEMIKYATKERADAIVEDIIKTSRSSIDVMRDIIWAIDARNDTSDDLLLRMEEQLEEMLVPAHIDYELDTNDVIYHRPLAPHIRQEVFFIFKEAITNTVKHSEATHVKVVVTYNKHVFRLDIKESLTDSRDELQQRLFQVHTATLKKTGNGLRNMHLRAKKIGALLTILTKNGYHITLVKYF